MPQCRNTYYHANISIPKHHYGKIVTERIASRHITNIGQHSQYKVASQDELDKVSAYREDLFRAIFNAPSPSNQDAILDKANLHRFAAITELLQTSKAISFYVNISPCLQELDHEDSIEGEARGLLAHPFVIALSAYHLGGVVNATGTYHISEWQSHASASDGTPDHYMEGDTGSIFDGLRAAVVWESTPESPVHTLSGTHNVFLTGDATPVRLSNICPTGPGDTEVRFLVIIYDARDAALSYYTEDREAIRKSVSIDLHRSAITDDDIRLLFSDRDDRLPVKLTLANLTTEFPGLGYASHFHRLLLSNSSLHTINSIVSTMQVPISPEAENTSQRSSLRRFRAWIEENWSQVPETIMKMGNDLNIVGTHPSVHEFILRLSLKACRDVHLFLGMDLVPENPIANLRELARTTIRDHSGDMVVLRLTQYSDALTEHTYGISSIQTTAWIDHAARELESCCLDLVGAGFVDRDGLLPSIAALSHALGQAIDSAKEADVCAKPWYNERDLLIYRTRCLYLFWCADWLVCCLLAPQEGPFMIQSPLLQKETQESLNTRILDISVTLLRNWVAWGMFMDLLLADRPAPKFRVQRPIAALL